jgi:SAM-dependent methyltransferase
MTASVLVKRTEIDGPLSKGEPVATLGLKDFARLFGTTTDDLTSSCVRMIRENDFGYAEMRGRSREDLILSVMKRIASPDLTVAGDAGAQARWERGWLENLRGLKAGGTSPSALVPKYIRPSQPVRLYQDYVMPRDPQFEYNWYRVFTHWLFQKYLQGADAIYEFGCGSGINIEILARLFPGKKIVGLDWAPASKRIVDELARKNGWDVEGRVFDFFKPDVSFEMVEHSAVLTVGALEQTGLRYNAFIDYLVKAAPSICVNVEPIVEWYDENNLADYLAIQFHKRRGYWERFPSTLKELERKGKLEIVKEKRSYFGSLYIEGYSQSVWRPKGRGG